MQRFTRKTDMAAAQAGSTQVVGSYIALVLIWAATPLAVVWSISGIHPMWGLIGRYTFSLLLMLPLLKLLQQRFPVNRIALKSYAAGSMNLIGGQFFMYLAASYLSSSLIALMYGFAPLLAGVVGHSILKTQKLKWFQWLGMVIALIGLIVVFLGQQNSGFHLIGVGMMMVSLVSYVFSIFWVKSINAPVPAMAQATGSIAASFLLSMLIVPFVWQYFPSEIPSAKALSGLAFTVVASSVIAMLCYFSLLRQLAPSTIALTNVMTPIVAMGLGALLNNEHISFTAVCGMVTVITGLLLYFGQEMLGLIKTPKTA